MFILRPVPSVLLSACPSVCELSGNSSQTFCQILIKFGMSYYKNFLNRYEFHENWFRDIYTRLKGVIEFPTLLYIFLCLFV